MLDNRKCETFITALALILISAGIGFGCANSIESHYEINPELKDIMLFCRDDYNGGNIFGITRNGEEIKIINMEHKEKVMKKIKFSL